MSGFKTLQWHNNSCYIDALLVVIHNAIWPVIKSDPRFLVDSYAPSPHFHYLVNALCLMDQKDFISAQKTIRDWAITNNQYMNDHPIDEKDFGSLCSMINLISF